MLEAYLILFRHSDTWKPGNELYYNEDEVTKAADRYSYSGETVLVVKVMAYKGKSHAKAGFTMKFI